MKPLPLLITLLIATLLTPLPPAHAEGMGYVDARRLIEQAPQGKEEVKRLEAEFAERNRDLKGRFDLFKAQEETLEKERLLMTAEELTAKTDELRELERQLRRAQREYNEDYTRRRNQGLTKLEKLITEVIIDVAKSAELDVVFQQVVYASPEIDLTDRVLDELTQRYSQ